MWSKNVKGNSSWEGSSAIWSKGPFGIQDYVCKWKERNHCPQEIMCIWWFMMIYSITTVLIRTKKAYKDDGKVITYFDFTWLGVSIPLLPGELLLFNATELLAITTQCIKRLDV